MADKDWHRTFDEPIPLPGGGELRTLRDAATYITKLPEREHDTLAWRAAIQALMLVAESGGPTMQARIGVMRALYRHEKPPAATPRRKRTKKYRIVRRFLTDTYQSWK